MPSLRTFCLCCALLCLQGPALALDMPVSAPQDFVEAATGISSAAIRSGQLAQRKSRAADVQAYAREMVGRHEEQRAALASLAHGEKLAPREDPGLADQAREALLGVREASFDAAYAQAEVALYERAIEQYRNAARNLVDPQLKAFAKSSLPRLEDDLRAARALREAHPPAAD
ncbi:MULTISPECIES: DUF4142 domain-containing protein [unclassified Pseudomonas]|uniref:DUF4142 domain-containing protein n=1 Tax=unclassified Pseudomonas TaxID=196821 RepID=UPI0023D829EA|nr:DUF4142 domain-containing protein [Pseudomonas sp. 273]